MPERLCIWFVKLLNLNILYRYDFWIFNKFHLTIAFGYILTHYCS